MLQEKKKQQMEINQLAQSKTDQKMERKATRLSNFIFSMKSHL
jgi:hypothetical protein